MAESFKQGIWIRADEQASMRVLEMPISVSATSSGSLLQERPVCQLPQL